MKKALLLSLVILMSVLILASCNTNRGSRPDTETDTVTGTDVDSEREINTSYTPRPDPEHTHTYNSTYNYNDTDHWQDATCGCGSEVITPSAHTFQMIKVVEPTFDFGGYTEYSCTLCGFIKHGDITDKLLHSYSNEWTFDETSHWNECTDNGYEGLTVNSGEHVMKEELVKDSSSEETGLSRHTCEVCGYFFETEIPRKAHIISLPTVDGTYYVGQTLSSVKLVGGEGSESGTFSWTDPDTVLTSEGTYSVTFTPDDTSAAPLTAVLSLYAKQIRVSVIVGNNGKANVQGYINVSYGGDLELLFTPDFGYTVASLSVGSISKAPTANYTLENITQNCTVYVTFEKSDSPVEIGCLIGNDGCYSVSGSTLTITGITSDTTYTISGEAIGNIVIDVDDAYTFELEMCGFSLTSNAACPISIISGDKVTISAKKGYKNIITDARPAVSGEASETYPAAIYSLVDLDIEGKGELSITSANNSGIWSKKDVEVKNLTLNVTARENALRGNDSISITGGMLTLIATHGDAVKTTNSDISAKGNQRGNITITGGTHSIYAAEDAIEAEHDVVIDDATTVLNIFTDTFSKYSAITTVKDAQKLYIRNDTADYKYSVKLTNAYDNSIWVDATLESNEFIDGKLCYFYSLPLKNGYIYASVYIYKPSQQQGQDTDFHLCIENIPLNEGYDTLALKYKGASLSYRFTNRCTTLRDGAETETVIGEFSSKGIKAGNSVTIWGGSINISSHGDAIRANNDTVLENGSTATGNVTVNGGVLTLITYGTAIHADGSLNVTAGDVSILKSYIGLEGKFIKLTGGSTSVSAISEYILSTTENGISITNGTYTEK